MVCLQYKVTCSVFHNSERALSLKPPHTRRQYNLNTLHNLWETCENPSFIVHLGTLSSKLEENSNIFEALNQLNKGFTKLFTVSKCLKHTTFWQHLLVKNIVNATKYKGNINVFIFPLYFIAYYHFYVSSEYYFYISQNKLYIASRYTLFR